MKQNSIPAVALLAVLLTAALWTEVLQPPVYAAAEPQVIVDHTPIPTEGRGVATYAPVVQKVSPSVVTVLTTETVKLNTQMPRFFGSPQFEKEGLGSGVIVTPDGYILSNSHVVEGAEEVKIRLADGTEYDATVIGADPKTDIAVLKVSATNLAALTFADSDRLQVGDVVLAIGNPFGVGQTVTSGIVSGLGRNSLGIADYEDFIQTDASINPGNSGGALVDAGGRLVGIPSAIFSPLGVNMGIGFVIPINLAHSILNQIVSKGHVVRGYLGVTVQRVTPELAREFKLTDQGGAVLREVENASPARQAGLAAKDVILEFQGNKVKNPQHFRFMVAQAGPGTEVALKLLRNGNELSLRAVLGKLPGDKPPTARATAPRKDALLGVTVVDLDQGGRDQFSIPADLRGALAVEVEAGSAAYKAGLRAGCVILEVNKQRARNAQEAIELSKKIRDERTLLRAWYQGGIRYFAVEPAK